MKKMLIIALVLMFSGVGFSQFKDEGFPKEHVRDGIVSNPVSPLFGFLSSENFKMNHSFSLSYSAFGGEGVSLGVYTNSMFYKFSDNLNAEVDLSFVNSPYSTLGKEFQNDINGIYISNASLNYKPWDDVFISVQYRNLPASLYSPFGYGSYYRGYNTFLERASNEDFFFER